MDDLLRLENLHVSYPSGFEALRDVSLSIAPNQRLGIVGGSGSGKTTLARVMVGLMAPTSGRLLLDGEPVSRVNDLRSQVSMVFQDPRSSLDPRMRVLASVAEPIPGKESAAKAQAALADVGLGADVGQSYPHELSGGQRQRVAIARALVRQPRLLIADEPVSALDVSVRAQVLNQLAEVAQRNLALVFISHDLAVVHYLCDQVVVLQEGELVEEGPVADVLSDPKHQYTKQLIRASLRL